MIVITGGAGFIGSALLWQLNGQGRTDILVVDHLGNGIKWKNLRNRSFLDYMHRDTFLAQLTDDTIPGIEAIVHLGACSSTTETDCDFLYDNNVRYTKAICRYAVQKGIRVIIASSAATYGDGSLGFSDSLDLLPKLRPLNMYGYSKHLIDLWLVREKLIDSVVSLKFFNVYGPNEYHKGDMHSVVAKAFEEVRSQGTLRLFASTVPGLPDGEQKRDFVYVKDCAALIAWFLTNTHCGIFNAGTGRAESFNTLGESFFEALGRETNITYCPMPDKLRGMYQSFTQADMGWLEQLSCPVRFTSLHDGVSDYVRHYLTAADPYL